VSIPIRNIYFLLSYAWDRLEEAGLIDVHADDFENVADLFSKVLTTGVRHLLRRGIDRGYREVEEIIPGIRGRINFGESLRSGLLSHGRAHCRFEELAPDTLPNRIMAQTMRELSAVPDLDKGLRDELRRCLGSLGELPPVRLTASVFGRVQLHGNNGYYRFLLDVCRLIHESWAVDERMGEHRFRDFEREEGPMARLFERFVFNFLKREQVEFQVSNRLVRWVETTGRPEDLELLPTMRTDVYLASSDRRIVIDAKYYRAPLQTHFGNDSVRSAHLYQLYAYMRNLTLAEPECPRVEGILLYPRAKKTVCMDCNVHGHPIRVATVDLASPWQDISSSLLSLVAPIN
jgi:5-methylcytosine-specific restriction enzyme subunit McrC